MLKRLELLHELVPGATRVAVLVNPANSEYAETTINEAELAGRSMGLQIQALKASTIGETNAVFATFVSARPDALFVGHDPFFNGRRTQLVQLAARYAVPASFSAREYADAAGLMSYGANIADAWRQAGAYAQRILKGCQACGLAGRAVEQVRVGYQQSDRHDAQSDRPAVAARHCRRGD